MGIACKQNSKIPYQKRLLQKRTHAEKTCAKADTSIEVDNNTLTISA